MNRLWVIYCAFNCFLTTTMAFVSKVRNDTLNKTYNATIFFKLIQMMLRWATIFHLFGFNLFNLINPLNLLSFK